MVLERRHFLQMRRAAVTIQVTHGPMAWGVGMAHARPLNTHFALRPAGGPTASGEPWRGHRRLCTSRPRGGATGSEWSTGTKDRASSTCKASAGGTCSARGEQNRAPPLRMCQKPESSLTQKLPKIQAQLSGCHSGHREAGRNPAAWVHRSQKDVPRLVLSAYGEAQVAFSRTWSPPGTSAPAYSSQSVEHVGPGGQQFRPPWTSPQWAPLPPHSHMELRHPPGEGPQRNSEVS